MTYWFGTYNLGLLFLLVSSISDFICHNCEIQNSQNFKELQCVGVTTWGFHASPCPIASLSTDSKDGVLMSVQLFLWKVSSEALGSGGSTATTVKKASCNILVDMWVTGPGDPRSHSHPLPNLSYSKTLCVRVKDMTWLPLSLTLC